MISFSFASALLLTAVANGRVFSNDQFQPNQLQKIQDLEDNPDIKTLSSSDTSRIIMSDILGQAEKDREKGDVVVHELIMNKKRVDFDVDFDPRYTPILELSTSANRNSDITISIADALNQLSSIKDAEIHITYDKERQQERGKPYTFLSFKERDVTMIIKKDQLYLKRGDQKVKLRIYNGNTDHEENEISTLERKNFVAANREKRLNEYRAKQKAMLSKDQQASEDPKEEEYSIYDTASLIVTAAVVILSSSWAISKATNQKEKRKGPPITAIRNAQAARDGKSTREGLDGPGYENLIDR